MTQHGLSYQEYMERSLVPRFWKYVRKTDTCWIWQGTKTSAGYGHLRVQYGRRRQVLVHRTSYELHYGPIPKGMFICHHCDNPSCVRPDHLFLGSPSSNMQDCSAKGRFVSGYKTWASRHQNFHPTAKLSDDIIDEIRTRYANGQVRQVDLASDYHVHQTTISLIVNRKIH